MKIARVTVNTDGSGDGTATTDVDLSGYLVAIGYDGGLASTADIVITGEKGLTLFDSDNVAASAVTWPVRMTAVTTNGTAVANVTNSYTMFPLAKEKVTVTVAQGGASDSGVFTFWWEQA